MTKALFSRHRSTGDSGREEGAVVLIFALLLLVLLGFAALAIDLGALFVERRHAQTAADVGVLSGAQFAGIDPTATSAQARKAVIDEVKRITAGNLASADWDTCVDPGRPSEYSTVPGETACVSFTAGLAKIRVHVPDQTFDTFFAGVLGVNTLSASATAVAGGVHYANGDILRFGVPAGPAADATIGCPHDHPNGLAPCNGPEAGNFNNVSITQWGLNAPPSKDCNPSNAAFEDNIAVGADHLLGIWSAGCMHDRAACNDPNIANPPGLIDPKPGNTQSALSPGLATGNTSGSGFDGRLTDTPYSTISFMGQNVDNTPLWEFIGSDLGAVPAFCERDTFTGGGGFDWDEDLWVTSGLDPVMDDPEYLEPDASFEHMARCLREYQQGVWDSGTLDYSGTPSTAPLFTASGAGSSPERGIYNLQLSPRWGWAPVGEFGNGASDPFKILAFKPIFIELLVDKCTGNNPCARQWFAGQAPTGGNFQKVRSIISFQLPDSTLPAEVHQFGPASVGEIEYTLIE